jgi:hypothetical protein
LTESPTVVTEAARWPSLVGIVPVAATLLLLGTEAIIGPSAGIAVAGGAIAVALVTQHRRLVRFAWIGTVGLVGSGLALASTAPFSLPTALLAGLVGVATLLWVACHGPPARDVREVAHGLLMPALAVLVAVVASVALPVTQQSAGVAGALLVAALVAAAYLLGSAGRLHRESPLPS